MRERAKPDLSNSLILWGKDVSNLPADLLISYCEKISEKLKGPNTIPESPGKLYDAMLAGKTTVAMDIYTNEIYGFARVNPDSGSQDTWILNSWTSFALGIGKPILWSAAALVYDIDPKAKLIAKVRERNIKAEESIVEAGGVLIGHETSNLHFNPNSLQPISKQLYDISLTMLMPQNKYRAKLVWQ